MRNIRDSLVDVGAHVLHPQLVVAAAEELLLVGHVPQVHPQVEVHGGALPELEDLAALGQDAFLEEK